MIDPKVLKAIISRASDPRNHCAPVYTADIETLLSHITDLELKLLKAQHASTPDPVDRDPWFGEMP